MRIQLIISFCLLFGVISAQKVLNVRYPAKSNTIELVKGVSIPSIPAGYTLWLPKKNQAIGLIVIPHQRRDSVQQTKLIKYALLNSLGVLYISTDNPLEFLFDEKKTKALADDILRACVNFNIPDNNLLFIGCSLTGTRALKLAIFSSQEKKFARITPKAVAICDVPLDMHRFYSSNQELSAYTNLSDSANFSASAYLEDNLDGTPTNSKARYASYSPYSKYVRNGGNAAYFVKMHVRGYIDADVNWNNEKLGQNSYDIANFINQLNLLGSTRADMIVSSSKKKSGNSWDIVDEKELVSWFVKLLKEE